MIWHVHSTMPSHPYWWARNVGKFAIYGRRVDAYLCPAENIIRALRARGAPRDRVLFMPSGIDVERFAAASADDRAAARRELGIPASAFVLLHFGWHWRLKGGKAFLDAVELLRERGHTDIVALERGADSAAEREITERGLGEVVRVVPRLPSSVPLFAAADVLVQSSRSEGMAYTVLESLCIGTPVVATDIPGHRFIGGAVDACRITSHAPAAIADAIEATRARPAELAAREATQARAWVVANLSLDVIGAQVMDVYRAALADPVNG